VNETQPTPTVQQFATDAVRRTLGRSTDVDACVALVGQINGLLGQAAAHLQADGATLACRAGCSHCCHLRVMVQPHEAIALFRYLQSRMPAAVAGQVRSRLREYSAVGNPGPRGPRPCAFLIDGECAAYAARPGACAAYHSLSREHCARSLEDPSLPTATVALQSLRAVAAGLEEGLSAAVRAAGLQTTPLELHGAVAALLEDPALIARWRAGRPLLNQTSP
jgi:uncharacterized protein